MFSLDQYKLLGNSGLRVSPLCLGTMTFFPESGWGADADECQRMVDIYADKGGNFIDTANSYGYGTSEKVVGQLLKGRRQQFVVATKYSMGMEEGDPNASGNHRKNMFQSVEASLERLQTDYIDILWLHVWENRTPIDEVMRAFDDLVRQGKILYAGISDTPAWKIAQANTIAELRGWTRLIATQVEYNVVDRTVERELIPMAADMGVGVLAWAPLAGGVLTGKYSQKDMSGDAPQEEGTRRAMNQVRKVVNEKSLSVAEEIVKIAGEIEQTPGRVALNWLLQRPDGVIPILGVRKVSQLEDNLGCLEFKLTPDELVRLDNVSMIEPGFPQSLLTSKIFMNSMVDMNVQIDRR